MIYYNMIWYDISIAYDYTYSHDCKYLYNCSCVYDCAYNYTYTYMYSSGYTYTILYYAILAIDFPFIQQFMLYKNYCFWVVFSMFPQIVSKCVCFCLMFPQIVSKCVFFNVCASPCVLRGLGLHAPYVFRGLGLFFVKKCAVHVYLCLVLHPFPQESNLFAPPF